MNPAEKSSYEPCWGGSYEPLRRVHNWVPEKPRCEPRSGFIVSFSRTIFPHSFPTHSGGQRGGAARGNEKAAKGNQEQTVAARSTEEQPGAARGNPGQPSDSQQQLGAARGRQGQPLGQPGAPKAANSSHDWRTNQTILNYNPKDAAFQVHDAICKVPDHQN